MNFTSNKETHIAVCLENQVLSGELGARAASSVNYSHKPFPAYDPTLSSVHWTGIHIQR